MIKSIAKAVEIMSCFSVECPVLTVGEISKITGINKSVVSRILSTLALYNCVMPMSNKGQYRLGIRFYQWISILYSEDSLPVIAKPIMIELRDFCGEEVSLYGINGKSRICLEKVSSKHELARTTAVGKLFPLHCGAAGKLLLAFMPSELIDEIIWSGKLQKFTPATVVDPHTLKIDLKKIREDGFAISLGERESGSYSVVAPVRDIRLQVIASLAISGPLFRLNDFKLDAHIKEIKTSANEISRRLGCHF